MDGIAHPSQQGNSHGVAVSDEQHLLIKFHCNYADEFDTEGFAIWPASKWEAHKEAVAKFFDKKKSLPKPRELPADYKDPSYYEIRQEQRAYEESQQVEVYFGTNESVYYTSLEDYLRSFKTSEITPEEHETFKKFFKSNWRGSLSHGMFLTLEDKLEDDSEDEEDED